MFLVFGLPLHISKEIKQICLIEGQLGRVDCFSVRLPRKPNSQGQQGVVNYIQSVSGSQGEQQSIQTIPGTSRPRRPSLAFFVTDLD